MVYITTPKIKQGKKYLNSESFSNKAEMLRKKIKVLFKNFLKIPIPTAAQQHFLKVLSETAHTEGLAAWQ